MSVIWETTSKEDATPVAAPLLSLLKSKPKDSREMQEKDITALPVPCASAAKAG